MIRKLVPILAVFLCVAATAAEPDREEYVVGEVKTLSPAGATISADVYLVKRTIRPAAGFIEVRTTLVPPSGRATVHVATFRVTGPTFTVSDPEGTYHGKGEWTGDPWRWKTWRYDISWPDGSGGLSGDDVATATHIRLTKRYRDRLGNATKLVDGELARVSATTYDILQRRLVP